VKVSRMRVFFIKLRAGVLKLTADNWRAMTYASGMMGPGGVVEGDERPTKKNKTENRVCPHCGSASHLRKTSKHCPANPKFEKSQDIAVGNYYTTRWYDVKSEAERM
jgi:hypothetical protein